MKTYYTYAFKMKVLTALDANEGNIFKTTKQFGIAKATLSDWKRNRERIFEQGAKYAEDQQLPLYQRLNMLINQISDALPGKVEQAKLGDATRALSIMLELRETLMAKEAAEQAEAGDVTVLRPFKTGVYLKYSELEHVERVEDVRHPIFREVLRMLDLDPLQIEISTLAEIPAGTGLGSSGSFTTALIKALHAHQHRLLFPANWPKSPARSRSNA